MLKYPVNCQAIYSFFEKERKFLNPFGAKIIKIAVNKNG
jgi:hypothetical protein